MLSVIIEHKKYLLLLFLIKLLLMKIQNHLIFLISKKTQKLIILKVQILIKSLVIVNKKYIISFVKNYKKI